MGTIQNSINQGISLASLLLTQTPQFERGKEVIAGKRQIKQLDTVLGKESNFNEETIGAIGEEQFGKMLEKRGNIKLKTYEDEKLNEVAEDLGNADYFKDVDSYEVKPKNPTEYLDKAGFIYPADMARNSLKKRQNEIKQTKGGVM